MLHALYRGMCTEGGRSRDGCPIGDLWAALYRGVPRLPDSIQRHCAAEGVLEAPPDACPISCMAGAVTQTGPRPSGLFAAR